MGDAAAVAPASASVAQLEHQIKIVGLVSNEGANSEKDRLIVPSIDLTKVASTLPPEYESIRGYRASAIWSAVYALLCVASAGILCIVVSWWPQLCTRIARVRTTLLEKADVVLAEDGHGVVEECRVHEELSVSWFEFKKQRYIYWKQTRSFERVPAVLVEACSGATKRLKSGLSSSVVAERRAVFGVNAMELESQSCLRMLMEKIVHPFYLFQLISVALWLYEVYYTYAISILVMSIFSIVYEVYSQATNAKQMQDLVACRVLVQVLRDGGTLVEIPAASLVVGDIVLVEQQVVAADMLLLVGECMADESSLTGEAIPVTKQQAIDPEKSVQRCHKSSVLYSGSTILRTKGNVWAVVIRTGFSTNKGELFRQILYPEAIPFQMVSDSYRYLIALSIIAGLIAIQRVYDAIAAGSTVPDMLISVFDLISTTIPAALPVILTVGVGFSLTRLRKARIFCIDAQKINIAGHLNCFCFDKTGTLTSEHLIFHGVDPCDGSEITSQPTSQDLDYALASCHGLSVVDGVVTGYALERDMFASTEYMLNASHEILKNNQVVLRYCHRFPFDAALQRSSVVVQAINETGNYRVFVKGSPEAMTEICESASLPSDFECRVQQYASQGYYCMGLATKVVTTDATTTDRAQMESNVKFSGFLLFVNPIKPESSQVFQTLESADIDVRIITGDNALTAMHVARQISMRLSTSMLYVDLVSDGSLSYQLLPSSTSWLPAGDLSKLLAMDYDLTISGSALEFVKQSSSADLTNKLVLKTKIFARIKPQLKTWIVQTLMDSGLCVGMTGDGTNDCGALKAAHVGLALSDAEASIVAPFTSRDKAIQDVVTLIREGRCALATSLLSFKFMVMYPIIETTGVAVLNHIQATFSNNQYLFDDMFVVLGISVLMLQTPPSKTLTKARPPQSLFAPRILWSIACQSICFGLFFAATLIAAERQPWFCSLTDVAAGRKHCYEYHASESGDMTFHSYEVSIVWLVGHWQYFVLAVALNQKDPFRESAWRNIPFVLYTAAVGAVMVLLLLWPGKTIAVEWFDLETPLPFGFCWVVGVSFLINLVLAMLLEACIQRRAD